MTTVATQFKWFKAIFERQQNERTSRQATFLKCCKTNNEIKFKVFNYINAHISITDQISAAC